jgi:hypothetical protein
MLPTTRAKTSKAAQKEAKLSARQHDLVQKTRMIKAVNHAVLEYATSTGKTMDAAQQELFTMERLSKRKRTTGPKDIFVQERMHEINKGTCYNLTCIMLGYH